MSSIPSYLLMMVKTRRFLCASEIDTICRMYGAHFLRHVALGAKVFVSLGLCCYLCLIEPTAILAMNLASITRNRSKGTAFGHSAGRSDIFVKSSTSPYSFLRHKPQFRLS